MDNLCEPFLDATPNWMNFTIHCSCYCGLWNTDEFYNLDEWSFKKEASNHREHKISSKNGM